MRILASHELAWRDHNAGFVLPGRCLTVAPSGNHGKYPDPPGIHDKIDRTIRGTS
jgi:hypothetical protein